MSNPGRQHLRSACIDCLFLTGLIGLSCSPYITGLVSIVMTGRSWRLLADFPVT